MILSPTTLAGAAATQQDKYRALLFCLMIGSVTALFLPFATAPWVSVPSFVPVYQVVTALSYLLASWLLFKDYAHSGSRSLLVLAGGCVWTGLILLAQLLTIPGVLALGRLVGGDQSTIHLWMWWHLGPPVYAGLYTLAERRAEADAPDMRIWAPVWTIACALVAFFSVLALVTVGHPWLVKLNAGPDFSLIVSTSVGPAVTLLSALAAALVWRQTKCKTVLQLWLVASLV
ncbi:MASE4 domain-containing protein [Ramlibacter sp.]|uniref:MASE4 domain-containing protein n=1 Tax=Ramlibacter sp. TaxID=1917967 RepID=UPI00181AC635|nr:MASE4 domain-containing protein [Ramlibacter sp.]MBA2674215.1 MASE4 domain-containing protein [Ramlibacter sp.]